MFAAAACKTRDLSCGIVGSFNGDMAMGARQGDEIALRIDDNLLNLACASFKQAPQQMRFS